MGKQLDIDDCLVENARATAAAETGRPYIGSTDYPRMVLDLIRIIDNLKKEKTELTEAVQRTVKE